jgi:CRP/FNR family transcriptional regulator, cyclic AMP receptor protein
MAENSKQLRDAPRHLADLLAHSPWAQALGAEELKRVQREIVVRDVPANGMVCSKGEKVESWIGVVEGIVKISTVSSEGKAVTFTGIPGGAWMGEGSLLKTEVRRYDVVAIRDSRIAHMPRRTFQRLLDTSIPFNRFLLTQLNERLSQFIAMVEFERLLGPDARVARCIAQMFNPVLFPGGQSRLDISQVEIGYLTGLSRQRVNKALKTLEEQQLLKVEYGGILVRDLVQLSSYED